MSCIAIEKDTEFWRYFHYFYFYDIYRNFYQIWNKWISFITPMRADFFFYDPYWYFSFPLIILLM